MATPRRPRLVRLRELLGERQPSVIDPPEFAALQAALGAPESWLRHALRDTGIPLAPLVEGVRQDSLDALERTLAALAHEYAAGRDRPAVRQAVLTAKEHARFALRRLEGAPRAAKEEMLLWMLTWLENPAVFAGWVGLRKRALSSAPPA
ncbi:MAG TPA: hypothetical protein DEH78_10530 [Solibacterales bacterium]|nr:hypothetical protein [Bryobacterales bacterium]